MNKAPMFQNGIHAHIQRPEYAGDTVDNDRHAREEQISLSERQERGRWENTQDCGEGMSAVQLG